MIDILQSKVIGTNKETWYKLAGTSSDTKPTGEFPEGSGHTVANGSRFFEVDTEIRSELQDGVWKPVGQESAEPSVLIEKEITENGVYNAQDDEADGYSKVTVNVDVSPQFSAEPEEFTVITNLIMKDAAIPDSCTSIGASAFDGCESLESVTIPNSVTSIGEAAFNNCASLKSISIPNGVESIEEQTFMNCTSLESITIPNSVTSIGRWVFYRCESLTSITIPDSVTSIDDEAFTNCNALETIIINQPEGSISGAPWDAPNATVMWNG